MRQRWMKLLNALGLPLAALLILLVPFTVNAQSYLSSREALYLKLVNRLLQKYDNPLGDVISNTQKLEHGRMVCRRLDKGETFGDIRRGFVDYLEQSSKDLSNYQQGALANYVVATSVSSVYGICPEYKNQIPD
jgi:hypothetical protein